MFLDNYLPASDFMMLHKWRTQNFFTLARFEHQNRATVLAELQRCRSPFSRVPPPHSQMWPYEQLLFSRTMNSSLSVVGAWWLKALWDPWG